MRHALQLTVAGCGKWKAVFDIARARAFFGVVGEFVLVVLTQRQVLARQTNRLPPAKTGVAPVLIPFGRFTGMNEELEFHLLELTRPERKIARRDLVAEGFADLRNPKRHAHPIAIQHIPELGKNSLGRLRAQIGDRRRVFDRAGCGLEHQIERPRLSNLPTTKRARRMQFASHALLGGKLPN